MNKLWKTTFYSILFPTIISFFITNFSVSYISIISFTIIILLMIAFIIIKKKNIQIICYSILIVSYISFWFDIKLLHFFSFNNGSIFPAFFTILLPYIGFGLYASNKDSGFRGTLQIRANYKIQDKEIVQKINKSIIPYSLLNSSILNFPLIFYFSKTNKVLISFLIVCLTIIIIEIYIRILINQKKKREKKEMNEYINKIRNEK